MLKKKKKKAFKMFRSCNYVSRNLSLLKSSEMHMNLCKDVCQNIILFEN